VRAVALECPRGSRRCRTRARAQQCLRAHSYRVIKSELRRHWFSVSRTMNEQVVSTNGRATRAIVRVRDKRIGESAEEKAVNPRGSSCAFHCESRAHNLARFMANPSSREPASEATCVVRSRDTPARNSPFPRYTARGSSRGMLHAGVMRARREYPECHPPLVLW